MVDQRHRETPSRSKHKHDAILIFFFWFSDLSLSNHALLSSKTVRTEALSATNINKMADYLIVGESRKEEENLSRRDSSL